MSACLCPERARPLATDLPPGSNDRPRQWFVIRRNESCSAFNGYRSQWSDFSTVECRVCSGYWKTKAKWVGSLRDCEYFPEQVAPRAEPFPDPHPLRSPSDAE
jgi:hypothetical protein